MLPCGHLAEFLRAWPNTNIRGISAAIVGRMVFLLRVKPLRPTKERCLAARLGPLLRLLKLGNVPCLKGTKVPSMSYCGKVNG